MADQKIEIDIQVNVDQSAKQIEILEKELEELNKTLEQTDKSTADYAKTQKQIADTTKKLTDATKTHTKNQLDLAIQNANNAKSYSDLNKALKQLKLAQESVDRSSPDFARLADAINETEGRVGDLNDSFRTLTGSGVERLNSSIGLLSEGFANFDLDKIKLSFQGLGAAMSAIPIFLVIEGIKLLIDNFDKVKEVIEAIFPSLSSTSQSTRDLEKANKKLIETNKVLIPALEDELAVAEAQGKSDKEILDLKKKINDQKIKELESNLAIAKSKIMDIKNNDSISESYYRITSSIYKKIQAGFELIGQDQAALKFRQAAEQIDILIDQKKAERAKEFIDQAKESQIEINKLRTENQVNEITYAKENTEKLKEQYKERRDFYLQTLEDIQNAQIEFEKVNNDFRKQITEEQKAEDQKKKDDQLKALQNQADQEFLIEANSRAKKRAEDKKDINIKNTDLINERDNLLKNTELTEAQRIAIYQKYAQMEADLDKQAQNEIRKNRQETFQIYQALANGALGIANQINDINTQKQEQELKDYNQKTEDKLSILNSAKEQELSAEGLTEEQKVNIQNKYAQEEYQIKLQQYNQNLAIKKKEFENGKKLAIASALIAGAVAAVNALSAAPFFPMAIIGLALATVTTALSVAKISSQKFDAGGSPPQPPTPASVSSLSSSSGNSNSSAPKAANFFGIGQGSNPNMSPGPQQVYVTEQDITSTQQKVAVTEQRAKLSL